jgi:hypothetical protein
MGKVSLNRFEMGDAARRINGSSRHFKMDCPVLNRSWELGYLE